jgi:hypothetical protein
MFWECHCECGRIKIVRADHLKVGNTKSCGCLASEMTAARSRTHGETPYRYHSPEYRVWSGMRVRCSKPRFVHYGGRGIKVCDRWHKFENFLADMGRRPSPTHSLDRIDVDGNYEPSNCRWATRTEQMNNTRTTRRVRAWGEVMPLRTALKISGIGRKTFYQRLDRGWDETAAVETPANELP